MSVHVMGLIWEAYPGGGSEKLVALALADEADHDGGGIFPSVARLARRCNMSERGIQKILRKIEARTLKDVPWFKLVSGDTGGRQTTRRYCCPVAQLKEALRTPNDVHPSDTERANDGQGFNPETLNIVRPIKGEQFSPLTQKGRTHVRKRANANSPDPLIPVTNCTDSRAPAREVLDTASDECKRIAFGDVTTALQAHGTPYYFCTGDVDRRRINAWLEMGLTQADLTEALARAHQQKTDGPIGPGYLNPIVRQVISERLTEAQHDKNGSRRGPQGGSATQRFWQRNRATAREMLGYASDG